jgi:hypothetical protein
MEAQPQSTPERPRPTWTQCTIVIFITMAAGVAFYLWRPLLLAPPRLELTGAVYLLAAMLWFPVLVVCLLLRPTGSTRHTLVLVLVGFFLSFLLCSLIPTRSLPLGTMLVPVLDCEDEPLPGNRVRYTCVADRMFYADTYILEGAEGSPFAELVTVETINY